MEIFRQTKKLLSGRFGFGALVFATALALYLLTLSPTVNLSDSGELAAVCYTLGVAHPTGYPTYTLFGRIFSHLLYPPVLGTNLMSAVFGALAVLFFALILLEIGIPKIAAFFGAISLAASKILWDCSVITEVYSLSAAFMWIAVLFLVLWLVRKRAHYLLAFAYFYGISLTNHMSAILWIPGIVYILWAGRGSLSRRQVLFSAVLFAMGLSVYLYLPIRSAQSPALDWGAPHTLARFLKHLTGWQYRVWMFSRPMAELRQNLSACAKILWHSFGWTLPVSFAGLAAMIISGGVCRRLGIFAVLVGISDVIYALNYNIPDIAPYYLPLGGALALGIAGVSAPMRWRKVSAAVVVFAAGYLAARNFPLSDQSDNWSAREYAENVVSFAPAHSLLILGSWDMYSPAVYLQKCEGIRPDLTLVDFALLRRSWYVEQLAAAGIDFGGAEREFLELVAPFEKGEKYNPVLLQGAFETMIDSLISRWRGPVYAFVPEKFFERKYRGIPEGVLLRVDRRAKFRPLPPHLFELFSTLARRPRWDDRERVIFGGYAHFFLLRAAYDHQIGALGECEQYLWCAHKFDPANDEILKNTLTVQVEAGRFDDALATVDSLRSFLTPAQIEILRQDIIRRRAESAKQKNRTQPALN